MSDLTGEAEKSATVKLALRNHLLTLRRNLPASARQIAAQNLQDQILTLVRLTRPSTIAAYIPIGAEPGGSDLLTVLTQPAPPAPPSPLGPLGPPSPLGPLGPRILLPILLPDNDLDWAEHPSSPPAETSPPSAQLADPRPTGALIAGPRGLLEPSGPRLGPAAITTADLILVPALAADSRGHRMGRGGGSYDRALARLQPELRHDRPTRWAQRMSPGDPTDSGSALPVPLVVALLHDWELIDEVPTEAHDRLVHATMTPTRGFVLSREAEWTK